MNKYIVIAVCDRAIEILGTFLTFDAALDEVMEDIASVDEDIDFEIKKNIDFLKETGHYESEDFELHYSKSEGHLSAYISTHCDIDYAIWKLEQ